MRAAVLTISDRVSRGAAEDTSGDLLAGLLEADGYEVERRVVPDERDQIDQLVGDGGHGVLAPAVQVQILNPDRRRFARNRRLHIRGRHRNHRGTDLHNRGRSNRAHNNIRCGSNISDPNRMQMRVPTMGKRKSRGTDKDTDTHNRVQGAAAVLPNTADEVQVHC